MPRRQAQHKKLLVAPVDESKLLFSIPYPPFLPASNFYHLK